MADSAQMQPFINLLKNIQVLKCELKCDEKKKKSDSFYKESQFYKEQNSVTKGGPRNRRG